VSQRDETIPDVSETLLKLLQSTFTANEVVLGPPKSAGANTLLTLFLYKVTENPYLKNDNGLILQGQNGKLIEQQPPLVVDLYYLLTAHATGQNPFPFLNAHKALSRAMRVFYDNGILSGSVIQTSEAGLTADTVLRVTLNPISMEDMTRIWSVFPDTQYELSVTYLVTPVPIESVRKLGSAPVVDQIHDQGHLHAAEVGT
jgi:Pvc16 N-terminal domain